MKAALLACPATREWATEKLAEGARQFQRIWERAAENKAKSDGHADASSPPVPSGATRTTGPRRTFPSVPGSLPAICSAAP